MSVFKYEEANKLNTATSRNPQENHHRFPPKTMWNPSNRDFNRSSSSSELLPARGGGEGNDRAAMTDMGRQTNGVVEPQRKKPKCSQPYSPSVTCLLDGQRAPAKI